jgi:hypothetical protein
MHIIPSDMIEHEMGRTEIEVIRAALHRYCDVAAYTEHRNIAHDLLRKFETCYTAAIAIEPEAER